MQRITALIVVVVLIAPSAQAQWAVHDPLNFAQAVIIAERTLKEYNTLVAKKRGLSDKAWKEFHDTLSGQLG